MKKILFRGIQLIVYDFDGVMTDNTVIVTEDGKEAVVVNRSDGLAVSKIKEKGIAQLIISAETSRVVSARAKKLGIPCLSGVGNKKEALMSYCKRKNINPKNVLFAGNDINDLDAMKSIGYPIAPQDACHEVKKIAVFITKANGGKGVVRELLDTLSKTPGF